MKKHAPLSAKIPQKESEPSLEVVPLRKKRLRLAGSIFILILCSVIAFVAGNMVGTKLVEYGVRDKIIQYKQEFVSKFKWNREKSVGLANNASSDSQTLKVGDVTIVSPGNGANQAQQEAFVKAIEKTAKETTTVNIGAACAMEPMVIKAAAGKTLSFTNADSVAHSLKIGQNKETIDVPAGSQNTEALTEDIIGIHSIVCDSDNKHVGFLQVTK